MTRIGFERNGATSEHGGAGPLLGTFSQSNEQLASWMSTFGDNTTIESLSIPGTHDSLACGFSRDELWSVLTLPPAW